MQKFIITFVFSVTRQVVKEEVGLFFLLHHILHVCILISISQLLFFASVLVNTLRHFVRERGLH